MGRGWKSFEVHARNMDTKGNAGEISDRNEEQFIENLSESDLCYEVATKFVELCSSVL